MADSLKKGIGVKFLLPVVALYAAAAGFLGVDSLTLSQAALQRVGIAGASGVGLLVLGDLVPRSVKEVMVFWRLRDRLPGCRAFTVIAPRDSRIDPTELAVLLPTSTMSPTAQNALWYRWLKETEDDPAVSDAHKRFLALRECAVLLFLLLLLTPFLVLFPSQPSKGIVLLGVGSALAYLLAMGAARNAAARLVSNVIARKVARS